MFKRKTVDEHDHIIKDMSVNDLRNLFREEVLDKARKFKILAADCSHSQEYPNRDTAMCPDLSLIDM